MRHGPLYGRSRNPVPGLGGGGRSRAKPVSAACDRVGNREKHTVSAFFGTFLGSKMPSLGL